MPFSTNGTHTEPIFKDLNVLTIDKLVIHRISIMMYKFNNIYIILTQELNQQLGLSMACSVPVCVPVV